MKRILALIVCGLILTGCKEDNTLRVGVGAPDSDLCKYTEKLNDKLEQSGASIRLKPIYTEDSNASLRLLNNGIIDLALINAYALDTALITVTKINPAYVAGSINEKNYEVVNDGDDISVYNSTVAGVIDEALHAIVREDSPYEDISDLGEKTVVVGSYDNCAKDVAYKLLKDHGIKREARKLVIKNPEEAVEMLKNKEAEALFLFDRIPSEYAKDLCNSIKVKFLSIKQDHLRSISKYEKYLTSAKIFPKQYHGQNEAVGTVIINILLQAHNGVDNSKIEELMGALFDINSQQDYSIAMNSEIIEIKDAAEPLIKALRFHPGAVRFYKNHDINVKETDHSSPLFDIHIVAASD
ncbi:TRAP transporter solute receptor, TAXI family [Succinivibrio dextrinosolvens DSM 3072]|uniref:TRAP transporter solute receptor, TAXI family n=1 Tax=Succinivibrio dextrinosolvens DSM 3072 TaxID=1123324 RepID=A0A1T4V281_9GAMM|nr:TAXI family TRAP transporter solute-binding subunit [Succinivibrio dextrinosolvens]SKA59055.1 TRAP transporter solute receptor, TAXI family [Succinivibrio dextrinosolvens DSM 3072]